MSADDREGQSVNGGAVQGNDLASFTREGANPRRQARSVRLRSVAQAHQPAAFHVHDAEETIRTAHTVILVERRMCRTVPNGPCLEGHWARPFAAPGAPLVCGGPGVRWSRASYDPRRVTKDPCCVAQQPI